MVCLVKEHQTELHTDAVVHVNVVHFIKRPGPWEAQITKSRRLHITLSCTQYTVQNLGNSQSHAI